ncbi:hypothetical protein [Novipirellula aureliae]|uniref:hypothetical protein n=1 Tax=Novipirellula aureliae TaxID=2527966 RepID=UPI001E3F1F5D|nr:hypothetical protein [Novipirellula aureliae]
MTTVKYMSVLKTIHLMSSHSGRVGLIANSKRVEKKSGTGFQPVIAKPQASSLQSPNHRLEASDRQTAGWKPVIAKPQAGSLQLPNHRLEASDRQITGWKPVPHIAHPTLMNHSFLASVRMTSFFQTNRSGFLDSKETDGTLLLFDFRNQRIFDERVE